MTQNNKEIIFFANGDPSKASTWSNVPYFVINEFEKNQFIVHKINLLDFNLFVRIIFAVIMKFWNLWLKISKQSKSLATFDRTKLYNYFINRNIRKAVLKYKSAKTLFFFNFSNTYLDSNYTIINFCDWTIEYKIEIIEKRKLRSIEKRFSLRQKEILNKSNAIITIFPNAYDFLKSKFPNKSVYYFGIGINSPSISFDNQLLLERFNKKQFLFVGNKNYLPGIMKCINSLNLVNQKLNSKYKINIIGVEAQDLPNIDLENVITHGYLNKSDPNQKRKYYEILDTSYFIINTSDKWVGASSIQEAMYHRLPIIIKPSIDIIKFLGSEEKFGFYAQTGNETELVDLIIKSLNLTLQEYINLAQEAYKTVKDMSRETITEKIINAIFGL